MSLRARVEKIERHTAKTGGKEVGAVIIASVAPSQLAEQVRKPVCAHILQGLLAGQQVASDEGETMSEFTARVDRIVEGQA